MVRKTIESLEPENIVGEKDDEGGIYYPLEIEVLTPEGIKTTSHFYDAGEKPCLRITTQSGMSLSGTMNHPLLVLRDGDKQWVRLSDIVPGDFVAIHHLLPKSLPHKGRETLTC